MHIITPYNPWAPKKKKTWQEESWEQQQMAEVEARILAEAQSKSLPPDAPNNALAIAGSNSAGAGGVPVQAYITRNETLNVSFTLTTSSNTAPGSASFVNTSTYTGVGSLTYKWTLGSGSLTSTSETPNQQLYTVADTYTVKLEITESAYQVAKSYEASFTLE